MLTKIASIRGIGRLAECCPKGDTQLGKLTLLYSGNGQGKTTLAAILRSLRKNDPTIIRERTALGVKLEPSVDLVFDDGTITYRKGSWSQQRKSIHVFDSSFVSENVHSGSAVEIGHRRALLDFALGEKGVELSERVAEADRSSRDAGERLRELARQIQNHMKSLTPIETLVNLTPIANIDALIDSKEVELKAAEHLEDVLGKDSLSVVPIPPAKVEDIAEVLAGGVDAIATKALSLATDHIKEVGASSESWLAEGLGMLKDDSCPFCGQSVENNDLVRAYGEYFSQEYLALKRRLQEAIAKIENAIGAQSHAGYVTVTAGNKGLLDYWRQYCHDATLSETLDDLPQRLAAVYTPLIDMLRQKALSPTEPVGADGGISSTTRRFQELCRQLTAYNDSVSVINKAIEDFKGRVGRTDMTKANSELMRLRDAKARFEDETVAKLCEEYRMTDVNKKELLARKDAEKEALDTYSADLIGRYQTAINKLLREFGAGFQVVQFETGYAGGKASSSYRIEINHRAVDVTGARSGLPSFGNTLSEGDKTSLALAFFLAMVFINPNLKDLIIVLDDPICSLDRSRRFRTQQLVAELSRCCNQVIVLSHDAYFLRSIVDDSVGIVPKSLCLSAEDEKTLITEWNPYIFTRSDYLKRYYALAEYLDGTGKTELLQLAQSIRPLLEGHYRARFPRSFGQGEMLGTLIEKIRKAGPGDELRALERERPEIEEINAYARRFHHDGAPGNPGVDAVELTAYATRALDLIRGLQSDAQGA